MFPLEILFTLQLSFANFVFYFVFLVSFIVKAVFVSTRLYHTERRALPLFVTNTYKHARSRAHAHPYTHIYTHTIYIYIYIYIHLHNTLTNSYTKIVHFFHFKFYLKEKVEFWEEVKNNLCASSFLLCKCGRTSDKTCSPKSMALQMPLYSKYVM